MSETFWTILAAATLIDVVCLVAALYVTVRDIHPRPLWSISRRQLVLVIGAAWVATFVLLGTLDLVHR